MSFARTSFAAGLALILASSVSAFGQNPDPYEKAAQRIETAIRENDAKIFPELFDTKEFLQRIFLQLPAAAPEEFKRGFAQPVKTMGRQLFSEWAKAVQAGGGFTLLRVRMVEGEPRGLMRLVGEQGLNYIDMIFSTDGGPPRMVDAYVAISGERLSETVGRTAALALAPDEAGGAEIRAHGKSLQDFAKLTRSAAPKEAIKIYETLPPKLQQQKMVMVLHIMNRMRLHEENPNAYAAAIEEFVKKFPTDPAVDLITIDGYFLRQDFAGGLTAINRLDKAVGGDVYLNVFRSTLSLLEMKPDEARRHIDKIVAAEPGLRQPHLSLADVALAQKDFPKLAETLTTLEEKFAMDFSGVASAPVFAPFRQSPEYAKWQAAREK